MQGICTVIGSGDFLISAGTLEQQHGGQRCCSNGVSKCEMESRDAGVLLLLLVPTVPKSKSCCLAGSLKIGSTTQTTEATLGDILLLSRRRHDPYTARMKCSIVHWDIAFNLPGANLALLVRLPVLIAAPRAAVILCT